MYGQTAQDYEAQFSDIILILGDEEVVRLDSVSLSCSVPVTWVTGTGGRIVAEVRAGTPRISGTFTISVSQEAGVVESMYWLSSRRPDDWFNAEDCASPHQIDALFQQGATFPYAALRIVNPNAAVALKSTSQRDSLADYAIEHLVITARRQSFSAGTGVLSVSYDFEAGNVIDQVAEHAVSGHIGYRRVASTNGTRPIAGWERLADTRHEPRIKPQGS